MRQVPHFLLIGNGRLARHFQHYFSLLSISYLTWNRAEPISALQEKISKATHILLLISDKAIDEFIQQHLLNSKALLIHCSGSLNSQHAIGAHPLMTFTPQLYELDQYKNIPFIIDANAPEFFSLLPGLPNTHVRLDKALKAKYHALCVLSGNFTCILWQKFFKDLKQDFNFPKEVGQPYFIQQMKNILADPDSALTGPLVRSDQKTIEKNIAALENDPFQEVYKSFVSCYENLNREKI